MRLFVATASIAFFTGISVLAGDDGSKFSIYAVYPIATELQKLQLGQGSNKTAELRAYLAIDGDAVIDDAGRFDPQALPVDAVRNSLAPYAEESKGVVVINVHFGSVIEGTGKKMKSSTPELESALEKLSRAAGFKSARVSRSAGGPSLEKKFSAVTDKVAGQADEDETPSGDDLVKVYPVRTILSLLLTDNCDCVIDVRAPLQKEGEELLTPDVRAAVVKHVSGLKLRHTEKALFRMRGVTERVGQERLNNFVGKEAAELAQSLGFKTVSVLSY